MEDHIPYHLEVCLPNSRLLSGLYGMWSSMKMTLPHLQTGEVDLFLRSELTSGHLEFNKINLNQQHTPK